MAFDWENYLTLAQQLNSGNPSEAQMRSSISRAYYGTYHKCRLKLSLNEKIDAHAKTIEAFEEIETSEAQTIATNLFSLRKARNSADYDGYYTVNQSSTNKLLNLASDTIKLLKEIDS